MTKKKTVSRSNQLLITEFTEQGLIYYLTRVLWRPAVLFFETEEFDSFLRKFTREYNSSIASFITKAYDADKLYEPIVKDNFKTHDQLAVAWYPALSIAGVLTGESFADTKPKSAEHTGYDNRFVKFIGSSRTKDIPVIEPLDSSLQVRFKSCLRMIEEASRIHIMKPNQFNLQLDNEAVELWSREYMQFKAMLRSDEISNVMKPYYSRAFQDYTKKIALNFQILELADSVLAEKTSYNKDRLAQIFTERLGESTISKLNLERALTWSRYFMQTANYAYYNYYARDNFDKNINKAIEILQKRTLGITAYQLKRDLSLNKGGKQNLEFNDLMNYLKEEGTITEEDGKSSTSKICKLRKHLAPN